MQTVLTFAVIASFSDLAFATRVEENAPKMVDAGTVTIRGFLMDYAPPPNERFSTNPRFPGGEGGGGAGKPGIAKKAADNNTAPDACAQGSPPSDKPVILATGEKYKTEHDIVADGAYGMGLDRTYKSFGGGRMFGTRWQSTYDYARLFPSGCFKSSDYPNKCMPTSVVLKLPDGATYTYKSKQFYDFTYSVSGSADMGTMTYDPDVGYIVTTSSARYVYSAAGNIQRVSNLGGALLLSFTYGTSSQLPSRVSNGAGHFIDFTYNSDWYVAKATDQDGNAWTYQYAQTNLLTIATSPGASPDVRTYFYESPAIDYSLLTGIAINGTRYSTYSYYPDKRVQVSGLAGGEERDTLVYGTNTTTITNAVGQSVTYNFTPVQGALKVSSISRAQTGSCSAANASTAYDANGWVDYTLDWNGNKDDYSYDAAGKLLLLTRAIGTSAANTEVYTWTGDNIAQIVYQDSGGTAYAQVTYSYVTSGFGTDKLSSETWDDLRTGAQRQTMYDYTFQANGLPETTTITKALPGDTATTTYSYDASGNLTSVTNALGQQIIYSAYNGRGFAGHLTDLNGTAIDSIYDPKSNLASSTAYLEGGAQTTIYTYNNARQVTDIAYPDGRVDRFRYNAALRRDHVGNAIGEFVSFAYDVPSNTSTISSDRDVPVLSGSTPAASRDSPFIATTQLDSLGRTQAEVGNNGQRVTYTYDNNGNVKTRTDVASHVTAYDYDTATRLIKKTAADGGITAYGYNTEGRLADVQDPRGLHTVYTYNGFGQVLTQSSPDTGMTTYTYDTAGRMSSKVSADGVTVIYSWDKLGRMTSRISGGANESFTYDEGTYVFSFVRSYSTS